MGQLLYFVKRREKDGVVVNTFCTTAEHALRKLQELHSDSHAEAWVEDADGNVISEKALKR
jgi:hypothetical protein